MDVIATTFVVICGRTRSHILLRLSGNKKHLARTYNLCGTSKGTLCLSLWSVTSIQVGQADWLAGQLPECWGAHADSRIMQKYCPYAD